MYISLHRPSLLIELWSSSTGDLEHERRAQREGKANGKGNGEKKKEEGKKEEKKKDCYRHNLPEGSPECRTQYGARTHDHTIKSRTLYQLS